ncbi:MAG: hypothetical protein MJA27_12950 [Pseudanabaenales cyanobacterium]|nr:hypothetical protein [Pseudanabaenales cyanobacterium]
MAWIYLIVQALFLWMLGRRLKEKHDGVYTIMFDITSLLSLLLGLIMAPLLFKLLPFLLIAPYRFFPNRGQNFASTQQSLAQTAKEGLHRFGLNLGRQVGSLFNRFGMNVQSPTASQSYTSFSTSADYVLTWSMLKDILLLLGGSLTAWFSYLSYEITHSIPGTLTKFGNRQVS